MTLSFTSQEISFGQKSVFTLTVMSLHSPVGADFEVGNIVGMLDGPKEGTIEGNRVGVTDGFTLGWEETQLLPKEFETTSEYGPPPLPAPPTATKLPSYVTS